MRLRELFQASAFDAVIHFAGFKAPEESVSNPLRYYPTPNGPVVRHYLHVVDRLQGHLWVLERLESRPGVATYHLGMGPGYSVLEVEA